MRAPTLPFAEATITPCASTESILTLTKRDLARAAAVQALAEARSAGLSRLDGLVIIEQVYPTDDGLGESEWP